MMSEWKCETTNPENLTLYRSAEFKGAENLTSLSHLGLCVLMANITQIFKLAQT